MSTNALYNAIAGSAVRFKARLACARAAQYDQLMAILAHNAYTEYGRWHAFERVTSYARFREQTPVSDYESLRAAMERMAGGEPDVLVPGLPLAFEETGGSTRGPKLIPYTPRLLESFRLALLPWLDDLAMAYPKITGGLAYWAISPAARVPCTTLGGIPIGLGGDAAYFGEALAPLVLDTLATPPDLAAITDMATWRDATCAHLRACTQLALVSVWSPTFFDDLITHMGARDIEAQWPNLQVVSCWDQAAAKPYATALRTKLGGIAFQGKGLLATEGVVSIPLHGLTMPVLALESGFFEFRSDTGTCHDISGVEVDGEYEVLMTTWGGLYRYAIGDRVRVHGFAGEAPLLEFLGRAGVTSDLCGEKLSEDFVIGALGGLGLRFNLLAPGAARSYALYVDGAELTGARVEDFAARADAALCANPQYAYARKLGQLAPVSIVRCVQPMRSWQRESLARGMRLGDIKPPALSARNDWGRCFEVCAT